MLSGNKNTKTAKGIVFLIDYTFLVHRYYKINTTIGLKDADCWVKI